MIDFNKFIFSTNYSDPLLSGQNPFPEILRAVLLSEKYTVKSALKRIENAKNNSCLIISDNGNFTRMSAVAKKFIPLGIELQKKAEVSIESTLKISADILLKRDLMIKEIIDECKTAMNNVDFQMIIERQLKSSPHYLIGLEDYTIPVLTITGLFHPIFKPKANAIKIFQQKTLDLYIQQKNGLLGSKDSLVDVRKYLVIHSYDYNSAKQGAKLTKNNAEGVAISFGGPMASRDYITEINLKGNLQLFDQSLPEPYIIACSIILGIQDGLLDKKISIHILGLGSPILIILLGYLLRNHENVSIDATSTFKDADDGTIYGSKIAYLKLDMYKVLAYCLINNEPYTSSSPFYMDFEDKFPSNFSKLRFELEINFDTELNEVIAKLKKRTDLIEKYMPYFTPMRSGSDDLIKSLRFSRSGSNYFVIEKICKEIRTKKQNETELKKWVFMELERYTSNASKKWAASIEAIIEIINKYQI